MCPLSKEYWNAHRDELIRKQKEGRAKKKAERLEKEKPVENCERTSLA